VTSIGTFQETIWVHDTRGERQITSEAFSFRPSFSADGKKLYYIVRTAGGLLNAWGSLWMTDLETGQRQRLLADFGMWNYSISPDGKRVVFAASKDTERPGVWLAALDGSSAPRALTTNPGLAAFFGAAGEVFYAAQEGGEAFVYRVKEDGSGLRKAIPQAVYFLSGVSPDGKSVAANVAGSTLETGSGVTMVYPLDGGTPTAVCVCGNRGADAPRPVSWSADGKFIYISLVGGQAVYAVPLRPGQMLPPLPSGGIHSAEEAAKLPGVKLLPVPGEFPGPEESIYAFPKFTAQRNIYRIPLE
jgi:Tol biopolymer transport system component